MNNRFSAQQRWLRRFVESVPGVTRGEPDVSELACGHWVEGGPLLVRRGTLFMHCAQCRADYRPPRTPRTDAQRWSDLMRRGRG